MKSIKLTTLPTQIIVQMPDKGISAINFTLVGFDVVGVVSVLREGKTCDYNRITDKETKLIVWGGKDVIDNADKLIITGYALRYRHDSIWRCGSSSRVLTKR